MLLPFKTSLTKLVDRPFRKQIRYEICIGTEEQFSGKPESCRPAIKKANFAPICSNSDAITQMDSVTTGHHIHNQCLNLICTGAFKIDIVFGGPCSQKLYMV